MRPVQATSYPYVTVRLGVTVVSVTIRRAPAPSAHPKIGAATLAQDIYELWRTFRQFEPPQLLSMTVDQSDRYYYRLQVLRPLHGGW